MALFILPICRDHSMHEDTTSSSSSSIAVATEQGTHEEPPTGPGRQSKLLLSSYSSFTATPVQRQHNEQNQQKKREEMKKLKSMQKKKLYSQKPIIGKKSWNKKKIMGSCFSFRKPVGRQSTPSQIL